MAGKTVVPIRDEAGNLFASIERQKPGIYAVRDGDGVLLAYCMTEVGGPTGMQRAKAIIREGLADPHYWATLRKGKGRDETNKGALR